jgi:hypothetical protein
MRRRTRRFCRPPRRPTARRITRRPYHSCLRHFAGYHRGPDDLAQALTALARAIRAHRRMAKLAPHLFDATEMNRIEQRKKEDAEWRAMWEPALEQVYGPSAHKWPERAYHMPLSPQTLRAMDRHYDLWRFWIDIGSLALERHQRRRPYALPSLSRVARLLDIGFTLGHLACGEPAVPDPSRHDQALADLERAYGRPLPGECASSSTTESHTASPPPAQSPVISCQPPPKASPPPDDKRDLVPHALVLGSHGFLCLQPIEGKPFSET